MRATANRLVSTALALLWVLSGPILPQEAPTGFSRAEEPRELTFPADHGSHPEFSTEWWYLTGSVTTDDGNLYGFQATWFRNALVAEREPRASSLAVRDVILFHGGLIDVERQAFFSESQASRAASSWAGAETGRLEVWLLDNRLSAGPDTWSARFGAGGWELDLELAPAREPLLHGDPPGLSRKGPERGQASYYYSLPRLEVRGSLRRGPDDEPVEAVGQAWFDHEFFSRQLAESQVGWDWFSVALDDGTDLMLFELRQRDGGRASTSAGTLRLADGTRRHLAASDFEIEVASTWRSPAAHPHDDDYPASWKIVVPSAGLSLEVEPMAKDQEHRDEAPGAMAYWEGLSRFRGRHGDRQVEGLGYVELVGYRGAGPSGL
jgi:predicted secreted hydrolase